MPPPRRPRRRSAAAAESPRPRRSGRLSARRVEPFKREGRSTAADAVESPRARRSGSLSGRRAEPLKLEGRCAAADDDDDGLPLSDEALLLVFSALSGTTAALVRCAATCRRWRRLVSSDAAFICRGAPPRSEPFIRPLALGFFHFRTDTRAGGVDPAAAAPPRFVPLSPAAVARHRPAIAAVTGAASRVVASRNGYLVLDLLRRARSWTTHAVRLGVCNPFTGGGGVDVLPPLRGKDSPTGPYACTVITAADEVDDHERGGDKDGPAASPHASYRVLLLYNRRSFTALRCYSSDAGAWGPETEVTGARIGRNQLDGGLHAAVVHRGVVFWPHLAVALPLDSLRQPVAATASKDGKPPRHTVAGLSSGRSRNVDRLLGVMPDRRMLRVEADGETIRAYHGSNVGGRDFGRCPVGEALAWKWTLKPSLMRLHNVRLRWLGEKSGVVVFTAGNFYVPGTHVYTLDVETKDVRMVATGGESSVGEVCGYEMDRVTLLASLGP